MQTVIDLWSADNVVMFRHSLLLSGGIPMITAVTHSTGEARITLLGVPDSPGAAGYLVSGPEAALDAAARCIGRMGATP